LRFGGGRGDFDRGGRFGAEGEILVVEKMEEQRISNKI